MVSTSKPTNRVQHLAAALLAALVAAHAPAQSDGPIRKPAETKPAATDDGYETIRISKPDGSVVTVRVPKRRAAKPAAPRQEIQSETHVEQLQATDNKPPVHYGPHSIHLSHPTRGLITLEPTAALEKLLPTAGSAGRVSAQAAVAGDDATEWRSGRGWAPGGESGKGGNFLDQDRPTNFEILVPGRGFTGSTSAPPPQGRPDDDGYDAQVIARWNCVPYQEVREDFIVGVVAFHKRGIKFVKFSLNDGDWRTVTKPALNPRTNTYEYAVTLKPTIVPRDGLVEIRAVVYPNVGEPRVLAGEIDGSLAFKNGEHSMFLTTNARNMLPNPTYYCSPDGDDTTGDGSEDSPFQTPSRAFREATQVYGKADGAVCYLKPGNYPFGPKPWPLIVVEDRWPILKPAPGVTRDQVVFDTGPVGGFSSALIAAHNVTITGDNTIRGGGLVWLDNCVAIGPGPDGVYNSSLFNGNTGFTAEYITNCDVSLYRNGVREATLTRNTYVHDIWGVPFGQTGLLVNATADNVNDMGTGSHGDILRWLLTPEPLENYIAYGVKVTNADVQGVFAEVQTGADTLDDVAMVNVHISKDAESANGSWWEPNTNHLLIWHCSIPDQDFRWAQEQYETSVRNVSIVGSIFGAFTYTRLPVGDPKLASVNHIHYVDTDAYGAYYVGLDRSFGDPGFVDPAAGDYRLQNSSMLRQRVKYQDRVVPVDADGAARASDTAIGPYATGEISAE